MNPKVPPHDDTAEQAVLGAMLQDQEVIGLVIQYLRPGDFYSNANKAVYEAILGLFNKGIRPDLLTLTNELRTAGKINEIGGPAYVASLTNVVASSANVEYYALTVQNHSLRRSLYRVSSETITSSYDESREARFVLEEAQQKLFELTENRQLFKVKDMHELIPQVIDIIERLRKEHKDYTGIASGFEDLDTLTSGFQDSEFIVIGARPSIGKTALALSMAANIALRNKKPVGFFTLEMSDMSLVMRLLSMESNVNGKVLRSGLMPLDTFPELMDAAGKIYDAPLYIVDVPNMKLLDLGAQARRLCVQQKVEIIFIDYLGLISSENIRMPRYEQISEVSRSLKSLARELHIPVVAMAQLTRSAEGEMPNLSSLRDSGSIEQDADVVMFLHRERKILEDTKKQNSQEESKENATKLILAKQRNGPVGTINLTFLENYAKFVPFTNKTP